MNIYLEKLKAEESNELINFILADFWEYHVEEKPSEVILKEKIEEGYYMSDNTVTLWIVIDQRRVGFIRLFDLKDNTCLFDVRIASSERQKGLGVLSLEKMIDYVFSTYPHIVRIEGYTRIDNVPMQKCFDKTLFVKEAHHRKSWLSEDGRFVDSIGYAVTRDDWTNNCKTPVVWS